ncbi:hypothetical protein PC9H_001110 [Pleurotus ostreatus]|uniref:Kinetochore protein Spc24 n=2 Tax=Pleurotus ostreatus TaxID=5322 RepID=A0A067PAU9_PLEO1|nr:uncharacterized protein PC9H_001110 [Pleurotus ostreatus]KAF7440762.1 hypothetical protein PC9H_001110 [Pleurotus ostreatus]KDQ33552.1 hypothetical protein PLEOSDRAFT_1099512 [Pleurotus ostreatus PC15]
MSTEKELQEAMQVPASHKLIRDMGPIIDPEEDFNTIVIAEDNISAAEARKKQALEEAYATLKSLSKILDAARVSSTRPPSVPSAEVHTATMNELDSSRLSLAKAVSDAEGLVASKEAEVAALKEEARRLELCDPASEHERDLDGRALRLQIYSGLGFTPVPDKDRNTFKILVNSGSTDLYSVPVALSHSDCQQTNHLWDLASRSS